MAEHKVITRWDNLKGRVELTHSDSEKQAQKQAQIMEIEGFYFDTDFCADTCPLCRDGLYAPGTEVTLKKPSSRRVNDVNTPHPFDTLSNGL